TGFPNGSTTYGTPVSESARWTWTTSTTRTSTFPLAARSASALTSRCNRIPDPPSTIQAELLNLSVQRRRADRRTRRQPAKHIGQLVGRHLPGAEAVPFS